MRLIVKCENCGSEELYLIEQGPHIAIRCVDCNKWLGWVKKSNLPYYIKVKKYEFIKEG